MDPPIAGIEDDEDTSDKIADWSKINEEDLINQIFDNRIINSLDHEALIRNVGGKA